MAYQSQTSALLLNALDSVTKPAAFELNQSAQFDGLRDTEGLVAVGDVVIH